MTSNAIGRTLRSGQSGFHQKPRFTWLRYGNPKPWVFDPTVGSLPLRDSDRGINVIVPSGLNAFFQPDVNLRDESILVLHGPKGVGKSTLLLAKRYTCEQMDSSKRPICLPREGPRMIFVPEPGSEIKIETDAQRSILEDPRSWQLIWQIVLGALALQTQRNILTAAHIGGARQQTRDDGSQAVELPVYIPNVPDSVLKSLRNANAQTQAAERLVDTYLDAYLRKLVTDQLAPKDLDPMYREIQGELRKTRFTKPICFFLDGMDEGIHDERGALFKYVYSAWTPSATQVPDGETREAGAAEGDRKRFDIWAGAQSGLIDAISTLHADSGAAVRVYATVRSEAIYSVKATKSSTQLAQICHRVTYTAMHLEAIIQSNVCLALDDPNAFEANDACSRFLGSPGFETPSGESIRDASLGVS